MSNDNELVFIILTSSILIVLAGFVIFAIFRYNKRRLKHQEELQQKEEEKQRARLNASIEAQESERNRIGGDIHDDIGPLLSSIKLYIHKFKYCKTPEQISKEIKSINGQVDEIIQRIRSVTRDLVPAVLVEFGFVAAVKNLCDRINESGQISINFKSEEEKYTLSDKSELTLYRVIQELSNNAIKHANASHIDIEISKKEEKIHIIVSDNGSGIPDEILKDNINGFGLKNIEARLSLIDGDFDIKGNHQGTKAFVQIPLVRDQ